MEFLKFAAKVVVVIAVARVIQNVAGWTDANGKPTNMVAKYLP
jgi:hypothetical protein